MHQSIPQFLTYLLYRMASSMRERIIEDFQSQLYKTCGIRSIVLTAYESEDNNLKIGFNDVSSVLEDGKDFRKYCPDWKSAALWEQWIEFGKKCFAKDTVQEPPPKKDRSRTLNTPIPIVFNKDGCPKLPKATMFDGYKAKVVQSLLREYCIEHIRFVTGNKKQTIPWGVLAKDPSSWIFDDCIPKDFVWKDPSKIQIGEVFHLLYHWKERQDQGLGPLMWVPTSPLFQDVEHPPQHKRHLRHARAQQSNASDQESFNLSKFGDSNPASSSTDEPSSDSSGSDPPHNRTSDGEPSTTEPSNKSSTSDESSDHAMATEHPPFHEPGEQSNPGSDGIPGSDRILDMAGPSDPHPVQQEQNQINTHPLTEEGKRVVIPTEKVKNMDSGRGAARIHPSYLTR
ncbi:hypothetical protein EDB86DRAFT_3174559 [Lactarius hatsudake]|nr:hypothetical protein EDB86DRAFT_3174559 [Lactarius hatsudake]